MDLPSRESQPGAWNPGKQMTAEVSGGGPVGSWEAGGREELLWGPVGACSVGLGQGEG